MTYIDHTAQYADYAAFIEASEFQYKRTGESMSPGRDTALLICIRRLTCGLAVNFTSISSPRISSCEDESIFLVMQKA